MNEILGSLFCCLVFVLVVGTPTSPFRSSIPRRDCLGIRKIEENWSELESIKKGKTNIWEASVCPLQLRNSASFLLFHFSISEKLVHFEHFFCRFLSFTNVMTAFYRLSFAFSLSCKLNFYFLIWPKFLIQIFPFHFLLVSTFMNKSIRGFVCRLCLHCSLSLPYILFSLIKK